MTRCGVATQQKKWALMARTTIMCGKNNEQKNIFLINYLTNNRTTH